jgi:hypothetical protein
MAITDVVASREEDLVASNGGERREPLTRQKIDYDESSCLTRLEQLAMRLPLPEDWSIDQKAIWFRSYLRGEIDRVQREQAAAAGRKTRSLEVTCSRCSASFELSRRRRKKARRSVVNAATPAAPETPLSPTRAIGDGRPAFLASAWTIYSAP